MPNTNSFIANKKKDRPLLLILCLLLSVALHLLAVFTLPREELHSIPLPTEAEKPTIVRLVDKPELNKNVEYEVDQKPTLPEEKPLQKTPRLAEKSQRVEKEQAPKGIDERDQSAKNAPQQPPPAAVKKPAKRNTPTPEKTQPKTKPPLAEKGQLKKKEVVPPEEPSAQPPTDDPSLAQLTQLPSTTLDRSVNSGRAGREKIKQRDDVDEGDAVWLYLERGMLISFFRRFRNQIEGVWNYPAAAAQTGAEGILLLKITIARNGELLDVDLLRSSGFDILDFEAIQAIYRAAPFGPLPKYYPHPELKIHAHFRYQLTGKYIYGRP